VVESVANRAAENHISGLRLGEQLNIEQASSIFNEAGYLTQGAIGKSDLLLRGNQLRNPDLIEALSSRGGNLANWGKYSTKSLPNPSGEFQITFIIILSQEMYIMARIIKLYLIIKGNGI
jgi:hypothetical protein